MPDGQHIVRFDEGDIYASPYAPEIQQRLLTYLEELYSLCDAVVLSDYRYGVLSETLIEHLQDLQAYSSKSHFLRCSGIVMLPVVSCNHRHSQLSGSIPLYRTYPWTPTRHQ